jgi:hypothetical protein
MRPIVSLSLLTLALASPAACSSSAAPDAGAGTSPPIATTAAFLDVPAQRAAATVPARIFHVLHAAENDRGDRPLFVLFNGGPGAATTGGLLPWGTAPHRLSTTADGLVANPARLTQLGDVLYVDQRQSGFSYGLGPGSDGCAFDSTEDAADFVRVVLHVLDDNPSIRSHPVVIFGESYGGVRASHMLKILLEPDSIASTDPDLAAAVLAHHRAVLGHDGAITRAEAARQFGTQILVEPNVLGAPQFDREKQLVASDPELAKAQGDPSIDGYDYRHDAAYADALDAKVYAMWADPVLSDRILGVPMGAIPGLLPSARDHAFRLSSTTNAAEATTEVALARRFGTLRPADRYFRMFSGTCWNTSADVTAQLFFENLRDVRTFITHAKYDLAVRTEAIFDLIATQSTATVTIDSMPRPGDRGRPGWVRIGLPEDPTRGLAPKTIEVRWPSYVDSGHMVAMTEGEALFADVQAFLGGE